MESTPTSTELLERASALERAGEWPDAESAYRALFHAAVAARDAALAADAVRGQARILQQAERFEEAEELAWLSMEVAERNGLRQSAARAVNTCAVIRYLQRDFAAAHPLFEAAMTRALDVGDDVLVGWACMNLGVLANIRGDLREARTRYLESIGSFVRSGNKQTAALVYNNLGMVCADLREWLEAEVCFDRGTEIASRISDAPLLAKLYANRAEPLLHLRNVEKARRSLDRAEELARRVDARSTLSEVARFRGLVAHAEGAPREAEAHLEHALEIARAAGLHLEEAEAARELGALWRELGRDDESRAALERARDLFRLVGADRDAERVEEALREPAAAAV